MSTHDTQNFFAALPADGKLVANDSHLGGTPEVTKKLIGKLNQPHYGKDLREKQTVCRSAAGIARNNTLAIVRTDLGFFSMLAGKWNDPGISNDVFYVKMRDDVATEGFRDVVPIADLQVVYAAVCAKSICAKYQGEPCMPALHEHSLKALGDVGRCWEHSHA